MNEAQEVWGPRPEGYIPRTNCNTRHETQNAKPETHQRALLVPVRPSPSPVRIPVSVSVSVRVSMSVRMRPRPRPRGRGRGVPDALALHALAVALRPLARAALRARGGVVRGVVGRCGAFAGRGGAAGGCGGGGCGGGRGREGLGLLGLRVGVRVGVGVGRGRRDGWG